MKYEWDKSKNRTNIAKHGICFHDACKIFDDVVISLTDDRKSYGEVRTISIGRLEKVAIIVVVHTDRHGVCRIISARPANQKERTRYETTL